MEEEAEEEEEEKFRIVHARREQHPPQRSRAPPRGCDGTTSINLGRQESLKMLKDSSAAAGAARAHALDAVSQFVESLPCRECERWGARSRAVNACRE